jgi:hypothetical protein
MWSVIIVDSNQHAHQGKGFATSPHPSLPKREMEIHVNLAEWGFGENNACKWPLRRKDWTFLQEASMETIRWRRLTSAVARVAARVAVVLGRLPNAQWATLIMVHPLMADWCRLILLINVSVRTSQKISGSDQLYYKLTSKTPQVSRDRRYFYDFLNVAQAAS